LVVKNIFKGEKSGWGEYSARLLILILVETLRAALVFSPVSARDFLPLEEN